MANDSSSASGDSGAEPAAGDPSATRSARVYLQTAPWTDEIVAIYVRGELTYDTGPRLEEEVERLVHRGFNTLVFDLTHVTELSNAGGSLLVSQARAIQDGGGRVTVVNPSAPARATLERLTVSSLLHVLESEDEAKAFHRV
ncbi:MAG: STAS domain-containing protein [Planctomycetota bacterium]